MLKQIRRYWTERIQSTTGQPEPGRDIHILWDKRAEEFFHEKRIFFMKDGPCRFKRGDRLILKYGAVIEPYTGILGGNYLGTIGAFSYTHAPLHRTIRQVGRYCSIASRLTIMGHRHPYERLSSSTFSYLDDFVTYKAFVRDQGISFETERNALPQTPQIDIGHDVWIGNNVTLASRLELGTGCLVAANATVVKDVPPYAIVGGNPAKIIKYRFSEDIIERLLASQWWQYDFTQFDRKSFMTPERALDRLAQRLAAKQSKPYRPQPLVIDEHFPEKHGLRRVGEKAR